MQEFMKQLIGRHKVLFISGIILICIILYAIWLYYENNIINVTKYEVSCSRLPKEFDDFRVAQISDFHNTVLGDDNDILIEDVKEAAPDIIVLTGDYIDSRKTDLDICESLAERLAAIAPTYYVTGNHESRIPSELNDLMGVFEKYGITVLRNDSRLIERGEDKIRICGIDDPDFIDPEKNSDELSGEILGRIKAVKGDDGIYTILLSHRPEIFDTYCDSGVELVFSGHAHGGQVRLPFIGPLYAPREGFFSKYAEGMHTKENTTMIVSRGLGQSIMPFRVNNSPELVVATLHCK